MIITDANSETPNKDSNEIESKIATQDSEKTDNGSPGTNKTERMIKSLAYKKVANKTRPIATTLPEEFRIVRRILSDPLAKLLILPTHPPDFDPKE